MRWTKKEGVLWHWHERRKKFKVNEITKKEKRQTKWKTKNNNFAIYWSPCSAIIIIIYNCKIRIQLMHVQFHSVFIYFYEIFHVFSLYLSLSLQLTLAHPSEWIKCALFSILIISHMICIHWIISCWRYSLNPCSKAEAKEEKKTFCSSQTIDWYKTLNERGLSHPFFPRYISKKKIEENAQSICLWSNWKIRKIFPSSYL